MSFMARRNPVMRVHITTKDRDTMVALLRKHHPDVAGSPTFAPSGAVRINAFVPQKEIRTLQRAGANVEVLGDHSAETRERRKEVGQGNRFLTGDPVPQGLGIKVTDGGADVS
jgi:hypothetical protein